MSPRPLAVGLTALIAVLACSSDGPGANSAIPPGLNGTYVLSSFDGTPMPGVFHEPCSRDLNVLGGAYTLRDSFFLSLTALDSLSGDDGAVFGTLTGDSTAFTLTADFDSLGDAEVITGSLQADGIHLMVRDVNCAYISRDLADTAIRELVFAKRPASAIAGAYSYDKLVYSSVADPLVSVDLIAQGDAGDMTLTPEGTYQSHYRVKGKSPTTSRGLFAADAGRLVILDQATVRPTRAAPFFQFALAGRRLTLQTRNSNYGYDFGSGFEPAEFRVEMIK